jgi:hypothetical protein
MGCYFGPRIASPAGHLYRAWTARCWSLVRNNLSGLSKLLFFGSLGVTFAKNLRPRMPCGRSYRPQSSVQNEITVGPVGEEKAIIPKTDLPTSLI